MIRHFLFVDAITLRFQEIGDRLQRAGQGNRLELADQLVILLDGAVTEGYLLMHAHPSRRTFKTAWQSGTLPDAQERLRPGSSSTNRLPLFEMEFLVRQRFTESVGPTRSVREHFHRGRDRLLFRHALQLHVGVDIPNNIIDAQACKFAPLVLQHGNTTAHLKIAAHEIGQAIPERIDLWRLRASIVSGIWHLLGTAHFRGKYTPHLGKYLSVTISVANS